MEEGAKIVIGGIVLIGLGVVLYEAYKGGMFNNMIQGQRIVVVGNQTQGYNPFYPGASWQPGHIIPL